METHELLCARLHRLHGRIADGSDVNDVLSQWVRRAIVGLHQEIRKYEWPKRSQRAERGMHNVASHEEGYLSWGDKTQDAAIMEL